MGIYEELSKVQKELKAPKKQYNSFGKYYYRNVDDILEAVKTITACSVLLTDEVMLIGDRFYIKATASLVDSEGNTVSATGYARESETKKGMDDAQVTGATSSYARKYALNALFSIDDTQEIDAQDNTAKAAAPKKTTVSTPSNIDYKATLESSVDLQQLIANWQLIPKDQKPMLEAFKNEMKTKLAEVK